MALGAVMPVERRQWFDNLGNVLAGGKVYFYQAGTSTAQAVYTDSILTVAHAQPVVLDGYGRATIYLADASYKVTVHDSTNTLLYTVDNVVAVAPFSVETTVTGTAGENIASPDVVYLMDASASGGRTPGRWYKAKANAADTSLTAMSIGVAASTILTGASGTIRIAGLATGFSSLVTGTLYYVSSTAAGGVQSAVAWLTRPVGIAASATSLMLVPSTVGTQALAIGGTSPRLQLYETDAGADLKGWQLGASSGVLTLALMADTGTPGTTVLTLTRTTTVPVLLTLSSAVDVAGVLSATQVLLNRTSSSSGLKWSVSTAPVDQRITDMQHDPTTGAWRMRLMPDSGVGGSVIEITRSGVTATLFAIDAERFSCTGQIVSPTTAHAAAGTTETIDWNTGNVQRVILDENVTLTLSNPSDGAVYDLILVQDAVGTNTVTWPAAVKWPGAVTPTIAAGANAVSLVRLIYDGTSSTYLGVATLDIR